MLLQNRKTSEDWHTLYTSSGGGPQDPIADAGGPYDGDLDVLIDFDFSGSYDEFEQENANIDDDKSSEHSLLNSHRRGRSHSNYLTINNYIDVGCAKKGKGENQRMIMMKNRANAAAEQKNK